jgi:predicted secreted protein
LRERKALPGLFAGALLCAAGTLHAAEDLPIAQPVVTLSASASTSVANDRMRAVLRAEADDADATTAARVVNERMAKALARAKAARGVDASTAGYSTWQVGEKGAMRWRVTQALALESADFPALAALVTRLQQQDGLLLSGVEFSVSAAARKAAEDALVRDAVRDWQSRAKLAAEAFGARGWRAGRLSIQGSDAGRPQPMYRAQAMAAGGAPVNVEGGTSEIGVSVAGEAILER